MASLSDEDAVLSEFALDGQVMLLTLNRPGRRNAINGAMLDGLEAALARIEADDGLRGLILTGAGPAFSGGADLKEQLDDPLLRVDRMHRLILRLRGLPVVSIAAIDGPALGGGAELAMACTFRTASPGARIGLPEIALGLMPAYGGTQTLSRLVGVQRALDMILSGEPVDAATALAIGLIDGLADEAGGAFTTAEALARRYAGRNRHAQAAALRAVRRGSDVGLVEGLAIERAQIAQLVSRRR